MEKTKEEVFELDFSSVTKNDCPVGETAFNQDKTDYGGFGNNTVYYEGGNVDIAWNGTDATVTGTLNKVNHTESATKLSADGHYFAFSLIDWFKNKQVTVQTSKEKTATETDWVCTVTESNKLITVKYGNTLVAKFDLTQAKLKP